MSYKIRSLVKEAAFWSAFGLWFNFKPVLVKLKPDPNLDSLRGVQEGVCDCWQRFGADTDDDLFIFVAHRRPESQDWLVPSDDQALLNGVNALGDSEQKSDDTFESLLLMSSIYSD